MLLKKYTGILHDYSCNEIELVKMSQKREQSKRKTLTLVLNIKTTVYKE